MKYSKNDLNIHSSLENYVSNNHIYTRSKHGIVIIKKALRRETLQALYIHIYMCVCVCVCPKKYVGVSR